MDLAPHDVQQQTFERAKRGFDQQQVGDFLERVAAALASRDRELHEARTEIEALNRAVADVKQNEEAFRLTMNAATQAKEEMLRLATAEAERLDAEARKGAEVVIERARVEAESHMASVKQDVVALREEKARLEHEIADLQGTRETVQNSLDALEMPEVGASEQHAGRPALELVVDKNGLSRPDGAELAARVGDLRG